MAIRSRIAAVVTASVAVATFGTGIPVLVAADLGADCLRITAVIVSEVVGHCFLTTIPAVLAAKDILVVVAESIRLPEELAIAVAAAAAAVAVD